jgi:hypothetical protein
MHKFSYDELWVICKNIFECWFISFIHLFWVCLCLIFFSENSIWLVGNLLLIFVSSQTSISYMNKLVFLVFFCCCRILLDSTFEIIFLVHHINGGGKSLMLLMLHKTFDFGFFSFLLTILVLLPFWEQTIE